MLLEFHYDYGKPFYQFFKILQLHGLTINETKALLLKLGEYYKERNAKKIIKTQPGRIEALRRITGGVIRTIIILFEIFIDDTNGNAFLDLEKILDIVTPLYQHRMDMLSSQQQEIIDFIALNWDAVSTKEIAKKTRIESKAVSSQLKQLEKYYIIEKIKTNTKNYIYRISERFFNIWYLMRPGNNWDEKRVRFLVEFLQSWCNKNELEKKALKHLRAVRNGNISAKHNLARMYFIEKSNKENALKYAKISYEKNKSIYQAHTYAITLLWNNDMEKASKIISTFINKQELYKNRLEDMKILFLLLIAKKQYHLTLKIFNKNSFNLKDRFKPIYYALMYFMENEYPNEYIKMGNELKETVEEIIDKINEFKKDYA